jgi:hypothetical protein
MSAAAPFSRAGRIALLASGLQLSLLSVSDAQSRTPLQLKPQSSADVWQLGFKAMLIAVVCLGLVAACLYGYRIWKRGQLLVSGSSPGIQLEAARRISQKTMLLTIQWQGRRYLLAENGGNTCVIDSREVEGSAK